MIGSEALRIDIPRPDDASIVPLGAGSARHRAPVDERALAAAFASGHRAALDGAFRAWGDLVHGVARSMVGRDGADDVTQTVFVQAWRSRAGFDPERGELPGWLVGITRNVCRTHYRRAAGEVPTEDVRTDDGDARAAGEDRVVDALLVADALRDLPAEQRHVLELCLLDDLTDAEAAERLGVPLGTVKSRRRLGLKRLRTRLGAPAGGAS